ncbi:MAG: polyphosphate kinase 1 [Spirochaetales bacterium]|nr:polyphosphate kinase 1 [Spirochaetales bacterium]
MKRTQLFVNRELRWLDFNERVLKTAESPNTPLMEKLKFIGIFSSNLDEFYSVRVGSINQMEKDPEHHTPPKGVKPRILMKDILKRVRLLSGRMEAVFQSIIVELGQNNIHLVSINELNSEQKDYINKYFNSKVRNRLYPIMLNDKKGYQYLKHVTIYLAVHMFNKNNPENFRYALIELPADVLPRYVRIPSRLNEESFIILDDIIRYCLKDTFNIFDYDTFNAYTIKITRDAEYDLTEEVTKSLYEKLSRSIRQRKMGDPVRVVYDKDMPAHLLEYLLNHAQLGKCSNILPGGRYHNARDMLGFPRINRPELYFKPQPPLNHHQLDMKRSLIDQIEKQDFLLSLPYQKYDYVIELLREAALTPDVTAIKMTLYRVAEDSSVVNALINAARNGKKVTVFIELQARFDEKANMYWTSKLSQENNISLISGVEGFKVHCKTCVITRQEKKTKRRVALIGTGNFNESTARLYSDHILMTSHTGITNEVNKVFKLLDSSFHKFQFKHLIISPFYTRKRIISMIKAEIQNVKAGGKGEIIVKINNLVDENMIKWLLKASRSGVDIKVMVRGIFSMATAPDGVEESHITASALIDRYLEHTRILRFHNNGEPLYYIGSADWMVRNLDNRIEVLVPLYDKSIRKEIEHFLNVHMTDTCSSFSIHSSSFNQPLMMEGDYREGVKCKVRAQQDLYNFYRRLAEKNE